MVEIAEIVKVEEPVGLAEYSAYAHLALAVQELRTEAALLAPVLQDDFRAFNRLRRWLQALAERLRERE